VISYVIKPRDIGLNARRRTSDHRGDRHRRVYRVGSWYWRASACPRGPAVPAAASAGLMPRRLCSSVSRACSVLGVCHASPPPSAGGGGRVGALLLSPLIKPGTVSTVNYNHYWLLRSIEDTFGLQHLDDAAMPQVGSFCPDVFG
jgi:hypothetical protein